MKKLILVLVFFIGVSFAAAAQEPISVFLEKDGSAGKPHNLALADMKLHPLDSFWYTESYFFITYLDSGEIAYLNLLVSNMEVNKNQPAMTITIITPDRKRLTTEKDFTSKDLIKSPEAFSLKIGNNLLSGDGQKMRLKIEQDGLGLDLEFASPTPGFKLGDGCVYFGTKKEMSYCINYPAPRARVSGTITYAGKKVQATGWGYSDHCWYNANTTDFERVWHNLKFFSPETTVIITSFTTPEKFGGKTVSLAAVVDDQKVQTATTDLKVSEFNPQMDPVGQKNYPQRIVYEFSAPELRGKIDFNSSRVIEKMDVLEKLDKGAANKALKWTINQFVAKPFYYRSFGPTELALETKANPKKIAGQASCEVIFVK